MLTRQPEMPVLIAFTSRIGDSAVFDNTPPEKSVLEGNPEMTARLIQKETHLLVVSLRSTRVGHFSRDDTLYCQKIRDGQ